MNEKFVKNMEQQLKPLRDLVELNNDAMQKLIRQQSTYMNELLQASMEQFGTLSKTQDLQALVQSQQAFIEAMGKKLMEAAQQNMEIMNQTRDATAKLIEKAVKDAQAQFRR